MTETTLTLPGAMKQAMASHQAGDLTSAETIYQKIVAAKPDHFDANHLLGMLNYQRGRHEEAERFLTRALEANPQDATAHCNHGVILRELRQSHQALASFEKAIAIKSDYADAYYNRGNALRDLARLNEAVASYDRALLLKPDYAKAHNNRGISLQDLARPEEAITSFDNAIALKPDYVEAYNNRGNTLIELKLFDEALASFDKGIVLQPHNANAYKGRGVALQHLKRFEEAIANIDEAIAQKSDYAAAHCARGNLLRTMLRLDEAVASYDRAIALATDSAEAYTGCGFTLLLLTRHEEALISFDHAIRLRPDSNELHFHRANALVTLRRLEEALISFDRALDRTAICTISAGASTLSGANINSEALATTPTPRSAEAYNNRALVLLDLSRNQEALASCDKAIEVGPHYADAYNNRGYILKSLGRHSDALASFETAFSLKPDHDFLVGSIVHTKMQICDWSDLDARIGKLFEAISKGNNAGQPFQILGLSNSLLLQQTAAKIWAKTVYLPNKAIGHITRRPRRSRLRIGYYSADFKPHPLAYLTAELFERHCHSRFELFAFSFGPNTADHMRQRLQASFDRFLDVRSKSDREIALLSRELEIDIAVDLGGFTRDSRPNIFALRAAPIQVSYLGYPGTTGAEYIDYLIADRTLIPEPNQKYYTEKIAYLPDTYLVNDSTRPIADRTFTRAELGLPEDGFVFCCFNNNWKITPEIFDCWMRLLERISGSVLWLLEDSATAARNLRAEAENRGIDSNRLIFAKRIPVAEHLARHRVADLFLDTLPYNAHTTASEALWCGLPVLTRIGDAFAGRVAASLLNAIGLSELITSTPAAYEGLAIELATKPEKLSEIKRKLASNRLTKPLFDTQLFTKHIEAAYTSMYELYQADLGPDHIYVPRRPLG